LVPLAAAFAALLTAGAVAGFAIAMYRRPATSDSTPPAVDAHETIHKELQAGRKVVLVDAKGPPLWHDWGLTPSSIGESPSNDGSATFQTNATTLLELVRNPGVDRYRITADLRHQSGDPPPPNGLRSMSYIGFYCGHLSQPALNDSRTHSLLAIRFTDLAPLPGPNPADAVVEARFGDAIFVQSPEGRTPTLSWRSNQPSFAAFQTKPVSEWPGLWRTMRFDITADSMTAEWWDEATRSFIAIEKQNREHLIKRYGDMAPRIARYSPGSRVVPLWHHQLGAGIIAYRSTVSFRNVVIEPLP